MLKNALSKLIPTAVVAGLMLTAVSPAPAEFKKTKIAVLDFQMQGSHETKDMDKIVSEWLITGLVETGRFDVVERRLLEKIMEEHKLGMTGIADPESVAQLGKVLGVKVIVTGTILSFDRTVEMNARLINVETGSIISAEKVHASSATRLSDLVSQIVEKLTLAFPLEGYVVMRSGNRVTVDIGKKLGCKPDMKFVAFKEGRVIKHPKTGEVLDVETIEIGEITITDVRDKTATGNITREASEGAVSYGSMVRSAVKGQLVTIEEAPSWQPKQEEKPRSGSNEPRSKPKVYAPPPSF